MNEAMVIDTNVLAVANGTAEHASLTCVTRCANALQRVMENGQVVIDARWEILREYLNNVCTNGQPTTGQEFMRWLLTNRQNAEHCTQVRVTSHPSRGYIEFPDDRALEKFDRSDRKFVAVAIAHGGRPPILNAVDSDWADFSTELHRHGVRVTQLCEGA